jgi:hypothetical protein
MYHMVDDIETQQEEQNSMNVIDDILIVEKRTAMERTGETQNQYNDIIIPESDIDPTKSSYVEYEGTDIEHQENPTRSKRKVNNRKIKKSYFSLSHFRIFNNLILRFPNSSTVRQEDNRKN